ncbi:hypothetical protein [Jannaschia donghaensis]|uniref:Uncharacterized protein n=1 Tax=Jannaschia donghaensis TaxID=420998 RepID=A0A0M6YP78_9RHOB|nr:hypothetical protein [Jannaschia donghaensis]CTQ51445.1 hypothetical protein JDO7802_03485 [Jannaschia donghaensis]
MSASVAVAVLGVTVLFCGFAYPVVQHMLIEDFDRTVLDQFHAAANTVEVWGHGDIYLEFNPSVMTGFAVGRGSRFYRAERSRQCLDRTLHRPRCPGPHAPVLPGTTASGSTFAAGLAPNGAEAVVVAQVVSTSWGRDPLETDIKTPLDVRETQINLIVAVDRPRRSNGCAFWHCR